jgi:hypothetical protein
MKRFIKGAVDAGKSLKPSEIRKESGAAKAIGTVVGAGAAAAGHPLAAPVIAKATEKAAQRVIDNPAVRESAGRAAEKIIGRAGPGARSRIAKFRQQD